MPKETQPKKTAAKKTSPKKAAAKKAAPKKAAKTTKTSKPVPEAIEPAVEALPEILDPIGDETSGEAKTALDPAPGPETAAEIEAAEDQAEAEFEAEGVPEIEAAVAGAESEEETEPEFIPKPRPPAKLDRLQKILAQAGVASRRKAEELIEQGRVQVNGKIVTELGSKADAARDHIRVDGKLLQGAERLRYFVLNKPRGFVTTVKDPEGRPTVMQFFEKMRERLYPVGRLDYMSEGLLLVTNDGELANRLTRAAAGVEKTYLVKVAGVPSEAELDILRAGVAIERGKPGSDRVRTSPARIRQVRQGDNPWYEVVLIEGRNRELRKMFEEIGHFVEKIRRVGYGPLILDQEPGNLRELDAPELELLRKAADGTLRTPRSKDVRRRNAADAGQLPTIVPRTTGPRASKPFGKRPFANKSFEERPAPGPRDYRPKRSFEQRIDTDRPAASPSARPAWKRDDGPTRPPARFAADSSGASRPPAGKPIGSKPYGVKRYEKGPATGRGFGARPPAARSYPDKPATSRPYAGKPATGRTFPPKPAGKKPEGQDWPPYKRPPADRKSAPRREAPGRDEDFGPVRPPNLHIEEIKGSDRPTPIRSSPSRPYTERPGSSSSRPDRPGFDRLSSDRPSSDRPSFDRPSPTRSGPGRSSTGRTSSSRPSFRKEGGPQGSLARPFTTSSGKPRAGGPRPSSKPGAPADRSSSVGWKPGASANRSFSEGSKPGGRTYGGAPNRSFNSRPGGDSKPGGPGQRPFQREADEGSFAPRPPRTDSGPGHRPGGKPAWKPKPSFGGKGKPGAGGKSRPPSKSGPRPGGKRPGSFGKKRP